MLVRELFGRLGLNIDPTGFDVAQRLFDRTRGGLLALGGAAAAMASGLAGAIGTAAARAGDISDLAERTGVAAETLQALDFGAKLAGIQVGELAQSLGFLSKSAIAAAKGSGEAQKAWAKAGVSVRDTSGQLKSADTLMLEVADTFAGMPEGVEKTALAMQLFGRSGAGMLPFLNQGSARIAELRTEATELGAVMSQDTIAAGDALGDNFGRLTEGLKGLRNLIVGPLFKPMADFVDGLVKWMRVNNKLIAAKVTPWLKAIGRVLGYAAEAGAWVVKTFGEAALAVTAFFLAWKLGTVIMTAVQSFATMTKGILLAVTALRSFTFAQLMASASAALLPLLWFALAAAIVLAYDEVKTFFRGGETLLGKYGEQWTKFLDDWFKEDNDDWWVTRQLKGAMQALLDLQAAFGHTDEQRAGRRNETQRLQSTYDSVPDEGFAGFWKRYVMIRPSSDPMDTAAAFGGGASPAASVASSPGARPKASAAGPSITTVGDIHVHGTKDPEETARRTKEQLQTELQKAQGRKKR